jgi:hypothetical protein
MYVSLTSIYQNQRILLKTLESLKTQTLRPQAVEIFLSEEPYLVDQGFKNRAISDPELAIFLNTNASLFKVNWVPNTGPYRKLLPILKEKWTEDCLIVTVDDDTCYHPNLLENLLADYNTHRCVVNYRGFTPALTKLADLEYNKKASLCPKYLYNFPTGKAGILYHPAFFHKTGELIFDQTIYLDTCKTADDIWFALIRILNGIECYLADKLYMVRDMTVPERALYNTYNAGDKNTESIKDTLKRLGIITG